MMPSQGTTIVVRSLDTMTHGFASSLFNEIPVQMEDGVEVKGEVYVIETRGRSQGDESVL
jgi:hypothetical protein